MYLIFKRHEAKILVKLNEEAAVFGINFLGDSATLKRMPFINTILLSANMSPVVLEIHDFLEHMDTGGNLDAPYIAAILLHHLTIIDKKKNLTDLILLTERQMSRSQENYRIQVSSSYLYLWGRTLC